MPIEKARYYRQGISVQHGPNQNQNPPTHYGNSTKIGPKLFKIGEKPVHPKGRQEEGKAKSG